MRTSECPTRWSDVPDSLLTSPTTPAPPIEPEPTEAAAAASETPSMPAQLDLASDGFDAAAYLAAHHSKSTHAELETLAVSFRDSLDEQTATLRGLVKENFTRFVSCRTAIDSLADALVLGDGAARLDALDAAYADLQTALGSALGSVLDSADAVARRSGLLGALAKHATVLHVPGRMAQAAQDARYELVVAEYSTMVGSLAVPSSNAARPSPFVARVLATVTAIRDAVAEDLFGQLGSAAALSLRPAQVTRILSTLYRLDAPQEPLAFALRSAANGLLDALKDTQRETSLDDAARLDLIQRIVSLLRDLLPRYAQLCAHVAEGTFAAEQRARAKSRARVAAYTGRVTPDDTSAASHSQHSRPRPNGSSDSASDTANDAASSPASARWAPSAASADDAAEDPVLAPSQFKSETDRVVAAIAGSLTEAFFPSVIVPSSLRRLRNPSSTQLVSSPDGTPTRDHPFGGPPDSSADSLPFLQELRVKTKRRKVLRPFMHAGIRLLANGYSDLLAQRVSPETLTPVLGVLDRVTRFYVRRSCSETKSRVRLAVSDPNRAWQVERDGRYRVVAVVTDTRSILADAFGRLAAIVPPDAELTRLIREALVEALLLLVDGLAGHVFGAAASPAAFESRTESRGHRRHRSSSNMPSPARLPTPGPGALSAHVLKGIDDPADPATRSRLLIALDNIHTCASSVLHDMASHVFALFQWDDAERAAFWDDVDGVIAVAVKLRERIARRYCQVVNATALGQGAMAKLGALRPPADPAEDARWQPQPWALQLLLALALVHDEIQCYAAPDAETPLLVTLLDAVTARLAAGMGDLNYVTAFRDVLLIERVMADYLSSRAAGQLAWIKDALRTRDGCDADAPDAVASFVATAGWMQFACFTASTTRQARPE